MNITPRSRMIQVAGYVYDSGGVGDGNLTQITVMPGGNAPNRVTPFYFDWRDRVVATKDGVQLSENDGTHRPILYYDFDNLDEVTGVSQYDGDAVTITVTNGVPDKPAPNRLRARACSADLLAKMKK